MNGWQQPAAKPAKLFRFVLYLMKENSPRICVPVCVQRASELAGTVARAAEVADIIELRLDYFSEQELQQAGETISAVLNSRKRPMILTLRPAEYGGARAIRVEDRLHFGQGCRWISEPGEPTIFCDLELDLTLLLQQREHEGNDIVGLGICDWKRSICSYHDFVGVPTDLEQIYQSMAATESRILKVAVQAEDAIDCLPIFRLLERAQREGREMIAIAMGQAGIMTRILGPSRGAFLTYGSLDHESKTAPGQLTARDLRELYRIDKIDKQTQIFGLMGQAISHSVSPAMHNAAFAANEVNAVYIPFESRDVNAFIRRMVHPRSREIDWNLRGLSVTAPHKLAVITELDWIDPAAKEIGAVNTIVVHGSELHGYNTDAEAFIAPLLERLSSLSGARCAVIGSGGAARAALSALRKQGADFELFVRDRKRGDEIAERFGATCKALSGANFSAFDFVVNATPLGTLGELENETPAISAQLAGVRLVYDLVYNPVETRFLREARAAGCETLAGIEMLVRQAATQFQLWTGQRPNVEVMRDAAIRALSPEPKHQTSNV